MTLTSEHFLDHLPHLEETDYFDLPLSVGALCLFRRVTHQTVDFSGRSNLSNLRITSEERFSRNLRSPRFSPSIVKSICEKYGVR